MSDAYSDPGSTALTGQYHGNSSALFRLALRTSLLSIVTLGIYRFWERTRIRRFIWSATAPGRDCFEYTGTGLEKLLGFLVAVIVLAVGLALIQTALFFAGLSVFSDTGSQVRFGLSMALAQGSFLLIVPLLYFARYRARRYKLARTRWRGIRFALDPGAFGYMWRAIFHLALTVLTLGLLWPRMTFWLEKYKTDRTWYGDARFTQTGRWTMLLPSLLHLVLGALITGAGVAALLLSDRTGAAIGALAIGPLWVLFGYVFYRVDSFRRLSNAKTLGDTIRFSARPRTWRVIRHLVVGGLLVLVLGGLTVGVINGFLQSMGTDAVSDPESLMSIGPVQLIVSLVGVMVFLAIYGTFTLVFITQPIVAHIVETAQIDASFALDRVAQRSDDGFLDADGLAAALDIGGAF